MTYISNSIEKAIELSDMAFQANQKTNDDETGCLIVNLKEELINARIAINMMNKVDERLHTFDIEKYGKLLDLLYEPEKRTA
jgi:hypothetical protein